MASLFILYFMRRQCYSPGDEPDTTFPFSFSPCNCNIIGVRSQNLVYEFTQKIQFCKEKFLNLLKVVEKRLKTWYNNIDVHKH